MDKASLRRHARAARRALPAPERLRQMERAREHLLRYLAHSPSASAGAATAHGADLPHASTRGAHVAGYLPVGAEPDVLPALGAVIAGGGGVVVPVCLPDFQLAWTQWRPGVPLVRSPHAPVDEPSGPAQGIEALLEADLLLVPAQAIGDDGTRLGQGGGYYDRFLERLRPLPGRPPIVAVVYTQEILAAGTIPTEETDQPVDGVLTADGLRWFSAR